MSESGAGSQLADAVAAIVRAAQAVTVAREELATAVKGARAAGITWTEIGAALGVSRQAAHERFGD